MHRKLLAMVVATIATMNIGHEAINANEQQDTKEQRIQERMKYYVQFQDFVIPWYYLAAIDQYERNIQQVRQDIPKKEGVIAIQFSNEYWAGALNPVEDDTIPNSIQLFGGMGLDGNGDGVASLDDDEDVMFTMAKYLRMYGHGVQDFKLALWDYYKNEQVVNQITVIAKLFEKFGTIDLDANYFPIPKNYVYSYAGTWGANRGWGGRRIHEGTDIFANYGTPILSTSYGVVEVIGWNEFGGWRIGIRDHHNSYHYYAHLHSFDDSIKQGDIVEAGQTIGYVGSTGYGKEGTAGKFPPHLHYGLYKFNGRTEWAYDPYPSLLRWERNK
ncbi:M23 family metallopeptidase [Solibacillus palustris]